MAEEGGAGGKEVGRISIRVVPNTDRFREDLQRQLDAIEKDTVVKLRVEPEDMERFRQEVNAGSKGLKDAKVKVKTEFDKRGDLVHDLDALVKDAGKDVKGARLDIVPNIQASTFQKALRDVKTQAKLAGSDVKLDIDFKDREATGRLDELIAKLRTVAAVQGIDLRVRPKMAPGELEKLRADARGGSGFGSRFAEGWKATGAEGGAEGGAGFAGKALMDQTVLIVVAVVALLAPALALLATSLASLPALVSAVAIPLGVLALGHKGIEKALEDVDILHQDTNKKGGDKGKPKAGEVLKQIQKPIEDVFEKGLTPIFRTILDALPRLTSGLPRIATGLVDMFRSLTNVATSPAGIASIQNLTDNVGKLLTGMAPGIASFGNAILNLASSVSNHFPGLATWFNQLGDKVSGWVDKMVKPGPKNWFTGQDTPSGLDKAITNLKPTLDGIVHFVGELMDAGLKMAQNPNMAENIKTTLSSITDFVVNTLPELMQVFQQVASLAKDLGLISSAGKDRQDPLDGSHKPRYDPSKPQSDKNNPDGKEGNVPGTGNGFFPPIKQGSLLDNVRNWWDKSTQASSKWLDGLTAGGFFRPHTDHPAVIQDNIGGNQPPAAPPKPAAPVGQADGGAGAVSGQMNAIKGAVGPAMSQISAGTAKVWDDFVAATKTATTQVLAEVNSWPGKITAALAGLGPAGQSAGMALGQGLANGIAVSATLAVAAAATMASQVEDAAKGALKIHSPSQVFHDIGTNIGEGLGNGIDAGTPAVIDKAKAVAQQLQDAMTGGGKMSKGLKDSVKQSMDDLTIESQRLKVQEDQLPRGDKSGRAALQAQRDQLSDMKEDLRSKSTELGYNSKYGANSPQSAIQEQMEAIDAQKRQLEEQMHATKDKGQKQKLQAELDSLTQKKDELKLQKDELGDSGKKPKEKKGESSADMLAKATTSAIDIGKNFAMANVNQFESDIGISGKGAIPTIANIGLDWATSTLSNMASGLIGGKGGKGGGDTHIHVNSLDEAMAAKKTTEQRQALTSHNA